MAIVKMLKFNLAVFDADRAELMNSLQQFNDVHFREVEIDEQAKTYHLTRPNIEKEKSDVLFLSDRVQKAIDILIPRASKPNGMKEKMKQTAQSIPFEKLSEELKGFDLYGTLDFIFDMDRQIRESNENIRQSSEKLNELVRWESIDLPPDMLRKTQFVHIRTGQISKRRAEEFKQVVDQKLQGTHVEFVSADSKNRYIAVFDNGTDEELDNILRDMGFIEVRLQGEHTIREQMNELQQTILQSEEHKRTSETQLNALAQVSLPMLKLAYESLENHKERINAQDGFLNTQYLTFLEGYIPAKEEEQFKKAIERSVSSGIYDLNLVEADKNDEKVPILLENNALVEPFEDIVRTYTLPKYSEPDPTPLITPWYLLFFGLMIADVGYGAVMFLATTLIKKFIPLKEKTKLMFRFFQILSIPTMIAGLCFGSCFGGLIPLPSIIDPTKNYMPMIIFSLVIGLINIFVALAIKGINQIKDGDALGALYDVGFWYMALGGAIVFGLGKILKLNSTLTMIGLVVMIVGMIGIVLFSAREHKGYGRFTWGLYNLYGITSYIGDFVSYTRIAALMLSGAFIGYAVNLIANMLFGVGFAGGVIGIIVLVFFHAFNLFLSGLSGYVHSMRLIYVEFFGKFYEGGGVPFKKLRSKSKYIDIK